MIPKKAAAASGVSRVVSPRLRVVQRDFLTQRNGRRSVLRSSVAVDYISAYASKYSKDPNSCPRVIDAEVVHGDEQLFWTARRDFYRGGISRSYYPTWDRQAQVLIMMTREVPRLPQEAAFRLFTLGLKMMLLPRLVTTAEMMLPAWLSQNAESLLCEALDSKKTEAPVEATTKDRVAAAATSASVADKEEGTETK